MLARRALLCLLALIFIAQPAFGNEKLIRKYAKEARVPPDLAIAIARQESGMNPLCINIEGKDFWPKTRAEAERLARGAAEEDLSYDVGLMQINSQWLKKWKLDPVALLDPETNIRTGIKILKQEIDRYGPNWKAVGAYHSPNPERAMNYANQVFGRMRGRGGLLAPRLEVLVKRGLMTRAEARSIMANPRLHGPMRKKTMRDLRRGAFAKRLTPERSKRLRAWLDEK